MSRPRLNREIDIARKIALGYQNKEIAEQLFLSLKTVEKYRQDIYRLYDVCDTVGLIKRLISEGKLTVEEWLAHPSPKRAKRSGKAVDGEIAAEIYYKPIAPALSTGEISSRVAQLKERSMFLDPPVGGDGPPSEYFSP
jgi:DNA-binding CsgD family transcriptional regulator